MITRIVSRNCPTKHQMDSHSMQLDAKLGIHQKYEYKFSNTSQLRRAAGLKSCTFQLAPADSQEKQHQCWIEKLFQCEDLYIRTEQLSLLNSSAASRNILGTTYPFVLHWRELPRLGNSRIKDLRSISDLVCSGMPPKMYLIWAYLRTPALSINCPGIAPSETVPQFSTDRAPRRLTQKGGLPKH
jgi:hypothetical protein